MLIGAKKGLFLARAENGKVAVTTAGTADTGDVLGYHDLPGAGVLIGAKNGLFLARAENGKVAVTTAADTADTGYVLGYNDLPGVGVLIGTTKGLFLARAENGKVAVTTAADTADTGYVGEFHDLPGAGVLIGAHNGLFLARAENGKATVTPAGTADTGGVDGFHDLPGAGVLIGAWKGLFLARAENGKVAVTPAGAADMGSVVRFADLPGAGVLIVARRISSPFVLDLRGFFQAHAENGKVAVTPAGTADTGDVDGGFHDLPRAGVLIGAKKGLFLARAENGKVAVMPAAAPDTGSVSAFYDLPGAGVLIGAENGLFLARAENGKVAVTTASTADTGDVLGYHDLPGAGVLVGAKNGLFLARAENGKVAVTTAADTADTGYVLGYHDLPGAGVLIGAEKGLFLGITAPLSEAIVEVPDRENLDRSPIDPKRDLTFSLNVTHSCAAVADKLDLKIRATPPDGKSADINRLLSIYAGPSVLDVSLAHRIDRPGRWAFQVISTYGGMERQVGKPQYLSFVPPEGPPLQRWGEWVASFVATLLVVGNVAVFGLARRSARAWRIATDDGWGTGVLRFATFLLSHFTKPQLWILDLYFGQLHAQVPKTPRPFMPLPLTASDGSLQTSDKVAAPPWVKRRLWVQGGSGMGKTALFRNITEAHFRDHETAFAAFAEWDCIVVAFAARDFAGSGEDKDDPAWVIDAVRTTLSSQGLTFASDSLLARFLESGTIGVAIDGLNEVNRTKSVAAFSKRFSNAPMLVTSQQPPGDDRFPTWCLPLDIRDFIDGLLQLYLPSNETTVVMEKITASGLKNAIRSGYDVRLIIDLARAGAVLPVDRMGLYAEVISMGWPKASEETRHEQQSRLAAAAWRMVSERKPNEDLRRLKPDDDLGADLLEALAAAPEKDTTPVHILRRAAGTAFEFIHDQMQFYMAARWFAQDGFSTAKLENMAASSTVWSQAPDALRTLWDFAAALLDDDRLTALWGRMDDKEAYDSLRRSLKAEAKRRKLAAVVS